MYREVLSHRVCHVSSEINRMDKPNTNSIVFFMTLSSFTATRVSPTCLEGEGKVTGIQFVAICDFIAICHKNTGPLTRESDLSASDGVAPPGHLGVLSLTHSGTFGGNKGGASNKRVFCFFQFSPSSPGTAILLYCSSEEKIKGLVSNNLI